MKPAQRRICRALWVVRTWRVDRVRRVQIGEGRYILDKLAAGVAYEFEHRVMFVKCCGVGNRSIVLWCSLIPP